MLLLYGCGSVLGGIEHPFPMSQHLASTSLTFSRSFPNRVANVICAPSTLSRQPVVHTDHVMYTKIIDIYTTHTAREFAS